MKNTHSYVSVCVGTTYLYQEIVREFCEPKICYIMNLYILFYYHCLLLLSVYCINIMFYYL